MRELLHVLVQWIHNLAPKYHYKLTGDKPECLSRLIELDDAGMHHLLYKCGLLLDETSKKYKRSGVDQHDMFAPLMLVNFVKIFYCHDQAKNMQTKEYCLTVGKDNNKLCLPSNQYGLRPSPDVENKKKIHVLEILPPTIRLSRDEKAMAEKLKVLVYNSMPMTVRRRNQFQSSF